MGQKTDDNVTAHPSRPTTPPIIPPKQILHGDVPLALRAAYEQMSIVNDDKITSSKWEKSPFHNDKQQKSRATIRDIDNLPISMSPKPILSLQTLRKSNETNGHQTTTKPSNKKK